MNRKNIYIKPRATVTILEIENALAAGSARILADDDNFRLYEDWTEQEEVSRTIDWF